MATTLELIDHSFIIDRKARRAFRSHGMKGKHVGKVRLVNNRRLPHAARINKHAQTTTITALNGHDEQHDEMDQRQAVEQQPAVCPKLLARMGNELSGLTSACEMTSQSRRFVHDCKHSHSEYSSFSHSLHY